MAASLRALRRRIRSTQSTKKIFSAQELIAGARIVRAQARVEASKPYAREITRVLSALASSASLDHPLLTERQNPRRAAVLVITSDRGLAGAYSSSALRTANELESLLRSEGKPLVVNEPDAEAMEAGEVGQEKVTRYRQPQPTQKG